MSSLQQHGRICIVWHCSAIGGAAALCSLVSPFLSVLSPLGARARGGGRPFRFRPFDLRASASAARRRGVESSQSSRRRAESSLAVAKHLSRARHVPPGSHLLFLLRYTQTKTILIIPFYFVMLFTHQINRICFQVIGFITPPVRFKKLRHKLWRLFFVAVLAGKSLFKFAWTTTVRTVLQSIHHRIVHLY